MLLKVCVGQDDKTRYSGHVAKIFVYNPETQNQDGIYFSPRVKVVQIQWIGKGWYRGLYEIKENTLIKFMAVVKANNRVYDGGTTFFLVTEKAPYRKAQGINYASLYNGYVAGQIEALNHYEVCTKYSIEIPVELLRFYRHNTIGVSSCLPITEESFCIRSV